MPRQELKRILVYLTPNDSPEDRAKLEEAARRTFRQGVRVDFSDPNQRNVDVTPYDAVLVSPPAFYRFGQDSLIANASWGD